MQREAVGASAEILNIKDTERPKGSIKTEELDARDQKFTIPRSPCADLQTFPAAGILFAGSEFADLPGP